MPIRGMKSPNYLDFIGTKKCPITGSHPSDCHHESVTRRFSGALKKHFDYGALPLEHEIHLYERHQVGKEEFWSKYDFDPALLVLSYLEEYVSLDPEDKDEAELAIQMVRKDNGFS